jgi:hypothetical protein
VEFPARNFVAEERKTLQKAFFTPAANRDLKPFCVRISSQISISKHVQVFNEKARGAVKTKNYAKLLLERYFTMFLPFGFS